MIHSEQSTSMYSNFGRMLHNRRSRNNVVYAISLKLQGENLNLKGLNQAPVDSYDFPIDKHDNGLQKRWHQIEHKVTSNNDRLLLLKALKPTGEY